MNRIVILGILLAVGVLLGSSLVPPGARAGPVPALSWHQISATSHPASRDRAGLAFDPSDHYSVLYGGYNAATFTPFYTDTWSYHGGVWKLLSPSTHPSAPTGFVMAYDPALSDVLLFGGEAPYGTAYYNETWIFHGGNWTQLSPLVSPPPRSQYSMAWDAADSKMVLFGGINGGSAELSDTWEFNGATWTKILGAHHPPGRQSGSMVYDAAIHKVLLFGGQNSSTGGVSGTWEFAGGHWTQVQNAGGPLRSYMLVSPMANGTPMILGGLRTNMAGIYNDSYEFFSGAWHKVAFANAPPVRGISSMTYDARDGYVLTFGGFNRAGGYNTLSDTWALF